MSFIGDVAGALVDSFWANTASGKTAASNERINKANIEATNLANKQAREWAVEDWNKTNEYNTPQQQMQRYREAGLNPMLIYGQGANTTAGMVRSTDVKVPELHPTHYDQGPEDLVRFGMSALGQMYNVREQDAKITNLQAQNELLSKEGIIKDLDILQKTTKNDVLKWDYQFKQDTADATKRAIELKNEKTSADIANTVTETQLKVPQYVLKKRQVDLQEAKNEADIARINAETAKGIYQFTDLMPAQKKKLDAEIDVLLKQGKLRQFDVDLAAMGIRPNDPTYMRYLAQMVNNVAKTFGIDLGLNDLNLNPLYSPGGKPGVNFPNKLPGNSGYPKLNQKWDWSNPR